MLNEELYEEMEKEFAKHRIEEEVEDILLDFAELLAGKNITGKEITCHQKIDKTVIEVCGICEKSAETTEAGESVTTDEAALAMPSELKEADEEDVEEAEDTDADEINVYIKWLKIGKKQFDVEDYIM